MGQDVEHARSFYDRLSRAYDLLAESSEHEAREKGLELLGVAPGEAVLEIGHGTGQALVSLATAVGNDGRVVGIDLSPGMQEVARERLVAAGLTDQVELDIADARQLPCRDGEFDAVFMSFTLELFDDTEIPIVLSEIRRVLRPRGRLGVVSLESPEETNRMVDFYRWFHRHFPHIADCQPIPVEPLLSAAGFSIDSHGSTSIWGLPVAMVLARPGP